MHVEMLKCKMFEDVLHLNRLKHVHESYLKAVDFKILCHILVSYFIPLYQIIVNNNDNNNDDKININSDYEEIVMYLIELNNYLLFFFLQRHTKRFFKQI